MAHRDGAMFRWRGILTPAIAAALLAAPAHAQALDDPPSRFDVTVNAGYAVALPNPTLLMKGGGITLWFNDRWGLAASAEYASGTYEYGHLLLDRLTVRYRFQPRRALTLIVGGGTPILAFGSRRKIRNLTQIWGGPWVEAAMQVHVAGSFSLQTAFAYEYLEDFRVYEPLFGASWRF